jgi:chromosome segregation ATPase
VLILVVFNKLIASLNSDMAKQTALARESKDLKKKLDSKSNEAITLQAQVAQLTASLAETKTTLKALESDKKSLAVDYKILNAKLNADRAAATAIESATAPKVPGSAVKPTGSIRLMGSVETAQAAQIAQLKEDLFSDLTGLIIRSVKREKDEDIFDCIQTGRYGSESSD